MLDTISWFALLFLSTCRTPIYLMFYQESFARIAEPALVSICVIGLYFVGKMFRSANVLLIGALANLVVLLANGGLMPVEQSLYAEMQKVQPADVKLGWIPQSPHTVVSDSQAQLPFLTDWIRLEASDKTATAVSPGDVVSVVGFLAVFCEVVVRIGLLITKTIRYRYRYAYEEVSF